MAKKTIKNPEEIRQFLLEACAKKELLVIITPYLKFESNFVHFDGNEVHVKTVTGGEDALNILNVNELQLRFPSQMDHLEASTKFIGLGTHEGSKTIKFAKPTSISVSSGRRSERLTGLEDAYAVIEFKEKHRVRAQVADLSAEGAKLVLSMNLPHSELAKSDRIVLSLHLPNDNTVNTTAIIRSFEHRTLGVEFSSPISSFVMNSVSDWIFKKKEVEMERLSRHSDLGAMAGAAKSAKNQSEEMGILLVTRDDEFGSELGKLFGKTWKYSRIPPAVIILEEALSKAPRLVVLHVVDGHTAERFLMRSFAEYIPQSIPIMLLGTAIDSELLLDIGRECRAVSSMLWAPNKALFLQRLVLGILRKNYSKSEGPMAPKDTEA